jgi:trans-aconitate 2-methyltransferase
VSSGTRDWDAATYDRVSEPQFGWGQEVLERLPLDGDEAVLDAGCGSGRVTRLLLERLPRGRVVAVDAAPAMVQKARAALGERATVLQSDLVDLELDEAVNVVFSTAVFHWIVDHDRLFARLHAALAPGGRLVAQCGGEGNVEGFHQFVGVVAEREPYAPFVAGWAGPWNFAGAQETEARLRAAGFEEVRCWLQERTIDPPEPADFVRTCALGHHLERLPTELHDPFVADVLEAAGAPPLRLDYVRLNIDARRPR